MKMGQHRQASNAYVKEEQRPDPVSLGSFTSCDFSIPYLKFWSKRYDLNVDLRACRLRSSDSSQHRHVASHCLHGPTPSRPAAKRKKKKGKHIFQATRSLLKCRYGLNLRDRMPRRYQIPDTPMLCHFFVLFVFRESRGFVAKTWP